jgi:hypothetical protein
MLDRTPESFQGLSLDQCRWHYLKPAVVKRMLGQGAKVTASGVSKLLETYKFEPGYAVKKDNSQLLDVILDHAPNLFIHSSLRLSIPFLSTKVMSKLFDAGLQPPSTETLKAILNSPCNLPSLKLFLQHHPHALKNLQLCDVLPRWGYDAKNSHSEAKGTINCAMQWDQLPISAGLLDKILQAGVQTDQNNARRLFTSLPFPQQSEFLEIIAKHQPGIFSANSFSIFYGWQNLTPQAFQATLAAGAKIESHLCYSKAIRIESRSACHFIQIRKHLSESDALHKYGLSKVLDLHKPTLLSVADFVVKVLDLHNPTFLSVVDFVLLAYRNMMQPMPEPPKEADPIGSRHASNDSTTQIFYSIDYETLEDCSTYDPQTTIIAPWDMAL